MEIINQEQQAAKILCCDCGIAFEPKNSNRCIGCIRTKNDITEHIPKTGTLYFCRNCERYLDPPENWILATLESKELLRLCLKKTKGLNTVRLVDARFAWTEPHSKRIKTKLLVQKELEDSTILQQDFIIEFTIQNLMCTDCHRVEAKDYWTSQIQIRQKVDHKRTFYYLEQLILKSRAHEKAVGIKPVHGGLDFFFATDQAANQLLNFLTSVVPCKWVRSKKLKSHDIRSNIFNYKHTIGVEIVPICKENLVVLPSSLAHSLGHINPLCLVQRVAQRIFLIDPQTAQMAELDDKNYWKYPFKSVCTQKTLVEYTVIDINDAETHHFSGQGHVSHRHLVSDVEVEKSSELGTGKSVLCKTHLGYLLKVGDTVLGYDLRNLNVNNDNFDKISKSDNFPDVILVKKFYGDKALRNRRRRWKLRHIADIDDLNSQNEDYLEFMENLEEDPMLRKNINIYKNEDKIIPAESDAEDANEMPSIPIEELLNELDLEEDPNNKEEEVQESEDQE